MNKAEKLIEKQIAVEWANAATYAALASAFENAGLENLAALMKGQSRDEIQHGEQMRAYLVARGFVPEVDSIKPKAAPKNLAEIFPLVLQLELDTTTAIHDIASAASDINDHAAYTFIQEFVREQIEEVDTAQRWVQRAQRASEPADWLLLDHSAEE